IFSAGLEGELAKVGEARDTHAHQAERARTVAQAAVELLAGERADRVGCVDSGLERRRAAADGEVGVAELRRNRSRDLAAALQRFGDFCRHPAQLDDEPARLARVARNLSHHLARRHAERASEARRGAHRGLYRLSDDPGGEEAVRDFTDVEVTLINTGLLDGRDNAAHRLPDAAGVLAVQRVPRADEDGLRAAAERLGAAHGGMDAEAARDVVRGRDDATPARIA